MISPYASTPAFAGTTPVPDAPPMPEGTLGTPVAYSPPAAPAPKGRNRYADPTAPTGEFASLVPQAAKQFGVPEAVMNWVGSNENGWKTGANPGMQTSAGQAQGPWQFMPGTSKEMGVDPLDARSSTFGAAKLLRDNFDKSARESPDGKGSWLSAVNHYGTTSTGDPDTDARKKIGLSQHLLDNGIDVGKLGDLQVSGIPNAGPGPAPTGASANTPAAAPTLAQQSAPPAPIAQMPDVTSAAAMAQQQPGNTGFFNTQNLLRIAAGFAGKHSLGEGISAAAQGLGEQNQMDITAALRQQQMAVQTAQMRQAANFDQAKLNSEGRGQDISAANAANSNLLGRDTLTETARHNTATAGIEQQNADTRRADAFGNVTDHASKLIELGVPPQTAFQISQAGFNGGAPGGASSASTVPDLSGLKLSGRSTAGETYIDPTGTNWQERNHPTGHPTFFNTTTGKEEDTLPPGSMTPNQSFLKGSNAADGLAEGSAQKEATGSFPVLARYQGLLGLLPHMSPGNDIVATARRNMAQFTGLNVGEADPAAIQEGSVLFQQLNGDRVKMLGNQGLGRINLSEVNMQKAAGPSWMQSPAALKSVINYGIQQEQMKQKLMDDWQTAQHDNPTVGGKGFRSFQYQFMKDNKQAVIDDSSSQSTGPDTRPSLDSIFSPSKQ